MPSYPSTPVYNQPNLNQNIPQVSSYPSTSVYAQLNLNQQVFVNQNILQVSLQNKQIADTSNINHPMANDSRFKRWLWLYNNNMKSTPEYQILYDGLRKDNSYNRISPVQVVQSHSRY